MADEHGAQEDPPPYTRYGGGRARVPRGPRPAAPAPGAGEGGAPGAPDGGSAPASSGEPPPYTVHKLSRRGPFSRGGGDPGAPRRRFRPRRGGGPRRVGPVRVLKWLAVAVVGWIALSLVVFLVSAQVHQEGGRVDAVLGGGGAPLFPTNVLIIGTDQRAPDSQEPGAEGKGGATRTDTLMLMRTGGLANARLSIPRDTIVDLEGRGRQKINAAYAFDGPRGTVSAVEGLTDLTVNHIARMDFENFPALVDAMGGISFTPTTCLRAEVSGGAGKRRPGVTSGTGRFFGGTSFRLRANRSYDLTGRQALALARVRKNECKVAQDDTSRARRQQQVLSAMKRRVISPGGFLRMPLIAWAAPKAVASDMSGPTLLGVALGQFVPGAASSGVLRPTGVETLPDGGQGLVVSPEAVQRAVRRYEGG